VDIVNLSILLFSASPREQAMSTGRSSVAFHFSMVNAHEVLQALSIGQIKKEMAEQPDQYLVEGFLPANVGAACL
jgi:hypothetical protein